MRVLGIELDYLVLHARLPKEKLDRITSSLDEWPLRGIASAKN